MEELAHVGGHLLPAGGTDMTLLQHSDVPCRLQDRSTRAAARSTVWG